MLPPLPPLEATLWWGLRRDGLPLPARTSPLVLCLPTVLEEMILIPACKRCPLPTPGTCLPSAVGSQGPRTPVPGAWPAAEPPCGPFVLCELDNGRHSQTSSHGSGPVKGPVKGPAASHCGLCPAQPVRSRAAPRPHPHSQAAAISRGQPLSVGWGR